MPEIRVIEAKNPEQKKLRVAAYCRVSSDSADQLASYRSQVNHYTTVIGANPEWELADIYADEGLTGTRADTREDFQRMLRDCAKGKVDLILVKSISRFARNTPDCLTTVRQLKLMGVGVLFEKEKIITSELSSEMFLSMYSATAQQESISISENMRWRYKHRMENGEFITCSTPFGYRLNGRDLVIHEPEAVIVRRIFHEYLSGKCKRQIADDLSAEQIAKRTGSITWRASDITRMLQNEKYTGNAILQKTYTTETLPFRSVINRGEKTRYHVQNSHPAIISPDEYVRARKLADGRTMPKSQPEQRTFSKKLVCGHCGTTFKHRVQNGKTSWSCYRHHSNKELCPSMPIHEPDIHAAFIRMWNKLLQNRRYILAPLLTGLHEISRKADADHAEIGALNLEISELTEQNIIINRLRAKGYLDAALFTQQSDEISGKLDALRARRRNLLRQDDDDPILAGIQTLDEIMENAEPLTTFDEDAFGSIVNRIIIDNETLRFHLSGGLELSEYLPEKGGRSR